ncbi:MAG TPA: phosphoribosylaminoimidazolesuccinocarboxamide synthase [Firmicutes bacterium]|uniref:phosphoribosylaminoimidazolesuccinocarboxamide synthase n=1 Tax=Capillibacterium thermochitinicola TaxID=2699427 RepID=A0A8J6LIB9_9FIRM|nr:phosphoribosylaminoimidazolesuccinocarboxamide synthase [Capillibacterium thermochitinicola]MBA2132950.1 phosphoribosylaminoimidazolesuccinocarboxamide synthase [Capillibacterium thermochitinicola]HHW12723.1 phosphoribosylaminoimidazolesuccinocarboxamide synthase [Bacillota bacterium]
MQLIKKGKTKDVYALEDGNILLKFKDDATVGEDGRLDPGGNKVGATIQGLGLSSLRISKYYFEKINAAGILTHYIDSDLEAGTMTVRPATIFGKGVEIICRLKATGSFIRRYGDYCTEGQDLDFYVEVSLKDDERGDPMITPDALAMLGIMSRSEYEEVRTLTKQITRIIRDDLKAKGLTLYDIKLEFGRIDGKVALIDEISSGCMRVYKDDQWLHTVELEKYFS